MLLQFKKENHAPSIWWALKKTLLVPVSSCIFPSSCRDTFAWLEVYQCKQFNPGKANWQHKKLLSSLESIMVPGLYNFVRSVRKERWDKAEDPVQSHRKQTRLGRTGHPMGRGFMTFHLLIASSQGTLNCFGKIQGINKHTSNTHPSFLFPLLAAEACLAYS